MILFRFLFFHDTRLSISNVFWQAEIIEKLWLIIDPIWCSICQLSDPYCWTRESLFHERWSLNWIDDLRTMRTRFQNRYLDIREVWFERNSEKEKYLICVYIFNSVGKFDLLTDLIKSCRCCYHINTCISVLLYLYIFVFLFSLSFCSFYDAVLLIMTTDILNSILSWISKFVW